MIFSSSISKVISSFEDLKKLTKKHITSNLKAFENLESWAQDSNNNAINDVSSKVAALMRQFSTDFGKEKASSFLNVSDLFKKFKEHDTQLKSLQKNNQSLLKKEKQCLKDLQKCPSSKNIRDLEVKYQRTKLDREKSEIKIYELNQEIETTKSILFKKNLKTFTDALMRQNEAEKVLIEAMQSLLDQIPDVSGEEVDNINDIAYKNKKFTEDICTAAKKKLSSLSSSSLIQKNVVESQDGTIHVVSGQFEEEPTIEVKKGKAQKKSCSISRKISDVENNRDNLYPSLKKINEEEPPKVPPPTYSDSENFYANISSKSTSVLPSAPCIAVVQSNNANLIQNNAYIRQRMSPSRNI
ncbi:Zinc-binding alcohol dehydrogenase domain-containing 2 [Brachionus plicatilis]|uniref:Zinc-binding alcohol dehydrogenase domain-containing 2 n=1 Tax=Brachionus plicatilis TaxID=10195 RepID=A0A3M7R4A0_BRAPC|nr:Zinc-binding alcohol dehydrogenase domain-containing 2 [Brachionus plicatilis]